MPINPADFVKGITNPYFPLTPGTTLVYETPDGSETVRFEVTRDTKMVMGVECVVVLDKSIAEGQLHERTFDYFAQDKDGNVWYFGEAVQNFENGRLINTNGSWLAGVNGAEPGIVMQANPVVGQSYAQENAPGIAEDRADVVSVTGSANVPYGSIASDVLQTHDYTPLEPALQEYKSYAKGIGQMLSISLTTGESERLTKIEFDGTSASDVMTGNIGRDVLRGYGGNDTLSGLGGDDVLVGGRGKDILFGGAGHDTFDFNQLSDSRLAARDYIGDFQHRIDQIDLRTLDADTHTAGNQAFHFVGTHGFDHTAGELRYHQYNRAGTKSDATVVSGDVNGDGHADFQIILKGLIKITSSDFDL